ncbi:MAG: hypothetical protein AAB385_10480 [Planctomycetota bacterium]
MPLSDVLHQDAAIGRITRALASTRVPHAYLFSGPPGVGKELLASKLAQLLLCTGTNVAMAESRVGSAVRAVQPNDSCGTCPDCILFAAGNHPDYHRIHRALNKMHPDKAVQRRKAIDLGVDVIRHFVLDRIMLCPSRGIAKVFIIVEADRLTIQAQNALLKTLEEPPGHSYLILLASAPDDLLATTRSRCQHIALGALPDAFVSERIERDRQLAPADTAFLVQLAQGSLGMALRYADMGIQQRARNVVSVCKAAIDDPLGAGKALAELAKELSSGAKDTDADEEGDTNAAREAQALVLAITGTLLRDVQRAVVGTSPLARIGDPTITALANRSSTRSIANAIRALSTAEYQIGQNANAGLIFDSIGIALNRAFGSAVAV